MAFIAKAPPVINNIPVTVEELISKLNFKLVPAGEHAQAALDAHQHLRSMNSSVLKPIDGKCCWCNTRPIIKPRRRYCSEACDLSAFYTGNPQSPHMRAYILLNFQQGACAGCGEIQDIVFEKYHHWLRLLTRRDGTQEYPVRYGHVGDNTGHVINVDHKVAMVNGGKGLDLNNIQVLCVACHRKKTKLDMA